MIFFFPSRWESVVWVHGTWIHTKFGMVPVTMVDDRWHNSSNCNIGATTHDNQPVMHQHPISTDNCSWQLFMRLVYYRSFVIFDINGGTVFIQYRRKFRLSRPLCTTGTVRPIEFPYNIVKESCRWNDGLFDGRRSCRHHRNPSERIQYILQPVLQKYCMNWYIET